MPDEVKRYLQQIGSRGGKVAAKSMTAQQRRARAVKASRAAAKARQAKKEAPMAKHRPTFYELGISLIVCKNKAERERILHQMQRTPEGKKLERELFKLPHKGVVQ